MASRLVIIVEHLNSLARILADASPEDREAFPTPSLCRFLARADYSVSDVNSADSLRCELFDLGAPGHPPVAALSLLAEGGVDRAGDHFWVRLDPVTLQADMTRVFVLNTGLDGFVDAERSAVLACMKEVLDEEQITSFAGDGFLCARLDKALPFDFPPLDTVLGMDMGEVLPGHPEARPLRRLVNEMQVALHHCAVNQQRRAEGRSEINGAWIWGGGKLPENHANPADAGAPFEQVFSTHPVSRGLAYLKGLTPGDMGAFLEAGAACNAAEIFLDWTALSADAGQELQRLEHLIDRIHDPISRGEIKLELHNGAGERWTLGKRQSRRFWRKTPPLHEALGPRST